MNKNRFIALVMELFFEEVLMKKNEYIGLNYKGIWYYLTTTTEKVKKPPDLSGIKNANFQYTENMLFISKKNENC